MRKKLWVWLTAASDGVAGDPLGGAIAVSGDATMAGRRNRRVR